MKILILPDIPGWVMEYIARGIIGALGAKFDFTLKYADPTVGQNVVDWETDYDKYDIIYLMLPSYLSFVPQECYPKICTSFHGGPGSEPQADMIQRMGLEDMNISYVSYQTRCRVEVAYKSSQAFPRFTPKEEIRKKLALRETDELNLLIRNDIQYKAAYVKHGFNLQNLHFTPYGVDTDYFNQDEIKEQFTCGYAGWARYLMNAQTKHRRGHWIIDSWKKDRYDLSIAGGLSKYGNKDTHKLMMRNPGIRAGLYDRHQIKDYYKDLSCYLVPDKYAGGPMPVLEAGAMGVPVVTTDCGHCGDFIEHGVHGIMIDSFNEFRHAIRWMKEHPAQRKQMGLNLRQYIREHRTWDAVAPYWEKFFNAQGRI